jgi:hypothetical protein
VHAAVTNPSNDHSTYSADYSKNASNPRTFFEPGVHRRLCAGLVLQAHRCDRRSHAGRDHADTVETAKGIHLFPGLSAHLSLLTRQRHVVDALRVSCHIFIYDTAGSWGFRQGTTTRTCSGLGVRRNRLSEALCHQSYPATVNPGDALQTAIGSRQRLYPAPACQTIPRPSRVAGERMQLSLSNPSPRTIIRTISYTA